MRKLFIVAIAAIAILAISVASATITLFNQPSPKVKYNPDVATGVAEISIDDGTTWWASDPPTMKILPPTLHARWHSTGIGYVGSVTITWQLQSSTDGVTWQNTPDPQFDMTSVALNGAAGQIINATESPSIWHNFVPSGNFAVDIYYQIFVTISR